MEQEQSLFTLEIDDISSQHLAETARWGRFLAITGIAGAGLVLLFLLIFGSVIMSTLSAFLPVAAGEMFTAGILTVFIVLFLGIAGTLLFFLLSGTNGIKRGIQEKNQAALDKGLAHLKVYFIIYTILAGLGLLTNLINLF